MKRVTHQQCKEFFAQISTMQSGAFSDDPFIADLIDTLRYYDNMAGDTFRAPNLANATNPFIVDELGEIRSEIKPRQKYEKVLGEVLKNQIENGTLVNMDGKSIEGDSYIATFKWVDKMIADGDKIKEFFANPEGFVAKLGRAPTYEDFQKPSQYWEIRTNKREAK